jgi:hypothetical protein
MVMGGVVDDMEGAIMAPEGGFAKVVIVACWKSGFAGGGTGRVESGKTKGETSAAGVVVVTLVVGGVENRGDTGAISG